MKLSQRHSGYDLTVTDWVKFLTCWKENLPEPEWDDEIFFIRFIKEGETPTQKLSLGVSKIQHKLPQSVLDFYQAYEAMGGLYRDPNISDGLGIISPNEIQLFSDYFPSYHKILNEDGIRGESSDISYFKYGIEQDNASRRTSNHNNAIAITRVRVNFLCFW